VNKCEHNLKKSSTPPLGPPHPCAPGGASGDYIILYPWHIPLQNPFIYFNAPYGAFYHINVLL